MKYQDDNKWVNTSYGPNGGLLWALLVAWLIVIYAIYYLISNMSLLVEQKPVALLYFVLVGEVLIAVFFVVFLGQIIYTIQSIMLFDDEKVEAKLFFGRMRIFKVDEIREIRSFRPKGIKSIYTPFDTRDHNYKIELNNGENIFVSGKTQNIAGLIDFLKSRMAENAE